MSWIGISLTSAAILGFVNIIDSYILSVRIHRFRTYLSILAPIYLFIGTLFYLIWPLSESCNLGLLLIAIGSSIIRAAAITFMLYTFITQEVSRVVPIVYAYPVLVAILAIPLLGENFTLLSWIAVIIVVAGVVLASIRNSRSKTSSGGILLLILTCGLFAVADLSSKYLLGFFSFWKLFSINALVMGVILGLVSFRPATFQGIKEMEHRNSALVLIAANEILALTGLLLGTLAISEGPISAVSAILGSRPVFVALFAIVISFVAPRFLTTGNVHERIAVKLLATLMIAIGVALIYLA